MIAGDGLIPPLAWTILNVIACLSSLILTIELVIASKVREEEPVATVYYLIWRLGTTLLWEAEVTTRMFSYCRKRSAGELPFGTTELIALIIEWGFAILFAFYAFDLLLEWKHHELDDIDASFVEAGWNTFAFALISAQTFLEYRQTLRQEPGTAILESYDSIPDVM